MDIFIRHHLLWDALSSYNTLKLLALSSCNLESHCFSFLHTTQFAFAFSIYGGWRYKFDSYRGMYRAPLLDFGDLLQVYQVGYHGDLIHSILIVSVIITKWSILAPSQQIAAGAVVITDVVFWLAVYPFLTDIDYKMDCVSFIFIVLYSSHCS